MKILLLVLIALFIFACEEKEEVNLCKNINCEEWQKCNDNTGVCETNVGFCSNNNECLGQNTYCHSNTHICNAIDLCKDIVCEDYEECDTSIGYCKLKQSYCKNNSDCNEGNYCNIEINKCEEEKVFDCIGVDCNNKGDCIVFESGAKCICDDKYHSPYFGYCELKPCDGGCNQPFNECVNNECQEIQCTKNSDCVYEDSFSFCMENGKCEFAINCGDSGDACDSLSDVNGTSFICDDISFEAPYGCMPFYGFNVETNTETIKNIDFFEANPYPVWIYYPTSFISHQTINIHTLNTNNTDNIYSQFFKIDSNDMMSTISYRLENNINYDYNYMPKDSGYLFILQPEIDCQGDCQANNLIFSLNIKNGLTCSENNECLYQEGRSICTNEACEENAEHNSSLVGEVCNYDENCHDPINNTEVLCLDKVNFDLTTNEELGSVDYCYARCNSHSNCTDNFSSTPYCINIVGDYSFCMPSCDTDNDCIITNRNGKCKRNEELSNLNGSDTNTCNFEEE